MIAFRREEADKAISRLPSPKEGMHRLRFGVTLMQGLTVAQMLGDV